MTPSLYKSRYYLGLSISAAELGPILLFYWLGPRFCHATSYHGIKIVDPRPASRDTFTDLVSEALRFIAEHDHRRFRRVLQEIRMIVHVPVVTGAEYNRPFRAVHVDGELFSVAKRLQGSVGMLACVLVHEATHGYLFSRQLPYTRKNAMRIEKVCCQEMKYFARRARFPLPDECAEPGLRPPFSERMRFVWKKIKEL